MKITTLKDGTKTKIFTKRELMEKLNFTDVEARIVMDYQKKLPVLLGTNDVDARALWEQLGQPQGEFNKWVKRKIIDKGFEESKDYVTIDKIVERKKTRGATVSKEYIITMDTAKNVAMMENTDIGRLVRKYFIKVEKALNDYEQWEIVRNPEKESYKQMCSALKERYMKYHHGKEPESREYSREADMLNESLLGYKAKEVRLMLDAKDKITREHLGSKVNKALDQLQILDTGLIIANMDFEKRKQVIKLTCLNKYGVFMQICNTKAKK